MRNNKPIPRSELKVGMRVKLPFPGKFFYIKKRLVWFKGTITKIQYVNNKIVAVETSLRRGNGYGQVGRWWSYTDNIDYIYKQL